jgi:hypothetical protein
VGGLFGRVHAHEVASLRAGPAFASATSADLGAPRPVLEDATFGCGGLYGGVDVARLVLTALLATLATLAGLAALATSTATAASASIRTARLCARWVGCRGSRSSIADLGCGTGIANAWTRG